MNIEKIKTLVNPPPGCPFYARCPQAMDVCKAQEPALREVQPQRWVACHLY